MSEVTTEAPFYVRWNPDRSPYAIELKLELVSKIAGELGQAEKLGIEVGGVLIGSFPQAQTPTLRIEDLEIIPRRPEDGPVYMLDPSQHERFAEARWRAKASGRVPIGFWRSHIRPGPLRPSLADRSLLSGQFTQAVYVVLLIEARGPRTTALFVATNGQVDQEPSVKEFRFDEAEFMSLPEIPADNAAEEQTASKPARAGNRWFKPLVIPLLIAVSALAALWAVTKTGIYSQGLRSSNALQLGARGNDHLVEISWNRGDRELDGALGATLLISDGASRQEIKLGQDELKLGVVEYQPNTQHIEVTMKLKTRGGAAAGESVEWRGK